MQYKILYNKEYYNKVKKMDDDLEKILNTMWKEDPHPTYKFLDMEARLLKIQAIRDLINVIKETEKEK